MDRALARVPTLLIICLAVFLGFANHVHADTVVSSNISTNTTWDNSNNVYIISGSISVDSGVTLTIDPGVVVKFEDSTSLTINGTLDVNGTVGSPVHFTSIKDDTVGGDTNSDGSSTSPNFGDWEQIAIQPGGAANFDNTVIRYGGKYIHWTSSCDAILCNFGGLLALASSTVTNGVNGISPNTGTTTINYSSISNHAGSGVYKIQGSGYVSVATSTFQNNTYYGIAVSGGNGLLEFFDSSFNSNGDGPVIINADIPFDNYGNTASNNGSDAIVIGNFSIGNNRTWSKDTIPYLVIYPTIASGGTVTVEAGTIIKHEYGGGLLTVEGNLELQGTESDPIYVTSSRDDSVGGDSNGDGTSTFPAPGDWENILVQSGGSVSMAHARVRYGGRHIHWSTSGDANIYNKGGSLSIGTSTISFGSSYNLHQASGNTIIWSGNIENSGSGVSAYNQVSATSSFMAANNYWGHATTGPYHVSLNPSGEGDGVSDYVDFSPWMSRYLLRFNTECVNTYLPYTWNENCNSVDNREIRWGWHTSSTQDYLIELDAATSTWANEGKVLITEDQFDPTVELETDAFTGVPWRGSYIPPYQTNLGRISIDTNKLNSDTSNGRQNTWTHELGHALGLDHSPTNDNVMYHSQTQQTILGVQDKSDYYYLWSY